MTVTVVKLYFHYHMKNIALSFLGYLVTCAAICAVAG